MRLGILGGTFDPPHNAHLWIARAAKKQIRLDQVLFAPAGVQPLKQDRPITPVDSRVEMIALAIAGQAGLALSRIDLDRPGPHYTVDLLRMAAGQYPGASLWFIMGGDSLGDLLKWRDPARLIALARLAVIRRAGVEPDWPALETALPDLRSRIDWIDAPLVDVSGYEIRRRVREGQSVRGLVPITVEEYIVSRRLYRE